MLFTDSDQAVAQDGLGADIAAAEEEQQGEAAIQVVLSGAVAKVVYKSAIQAIPNSLAFRHSFLKLLAQFKFEGSDAIQQAILGSIQRDFGDTEESWALRAQAASINQSSNSVSSQVLPCKCQGKHKHYLCLSSLNNKA